MDLKQIRIVKYFLDITEPIVDKAKKITLPGFDGVPLYDVVYFFVRGLMEGSLTTRASGIAFSFYLALFPALIFVFTLIPYIPIDNFQIELMSLLQSILPKNAYLTFEETLQDIITNQRGSLLSIGFFAAMIFSTNGFNSMIDAFNATKHTIEVRSWLAQRMISFVLVIIIFTLTLTSVSLIVASQWAMDFLVEHEILKDNFTIILLATGKWIIILALFFFSISFLYFLAPAKKDKFRFISAGSTLATLLTILISVGFSYYINNFGRYNALYGSIGTILVILMWLYLNSITLLIGFELNASIKNAKLVDKWA
ncbi:MAG: YihY/virulence factor BrkB family protein [Bacteroidales bacterium]|nr:YihY/virulence factor BrkB family protein [Bacteroidales bacterium]MCF8458343.1 YihY/virulence factor BrkB family protein [Bacteroidales bacterium]